MTKSLEMRLFLLTLSGDSDMVTLCVVGTVSRTFVGLLRTQKIAKNHHLGTIAQLCWAVSYLCN